MTEKPKIEPEEFEKLFSKKMLLRSEVLQKVYSLSIQELESLLEVLEAEEVKH